MLNVLHFGILCFNLIGGIASAKPVQPADSTLVDRGLDLDWPDLLGPDNKPSIDHIIQLFSRYDVDLFFENSFEQQRQWDDMYSGTSFWGTLIAMTKFHENGDWIKLMFDSADPQGGPDGLGTVTVNLYAPGADGTKPTLEKQSIDIKSLPRGTYEGPLWPMAIVEAMLQAEWDPNVDGSKSAVEMLTGYKAKKIENPTSDQSWEEFGKADVRPVLFQREEKEFPHPVHPVRVVMTVTGEGDEKKVDCGHLLAYDLTHWRQDYAPDESDPLIQITVLDDERFTKFDGKLPEQ